MNLERFHSTRSPDWQSLDALLGRARAKPESLPPDEVLELGALYRRTAADLATARRKWPGDPIVGWLEDLVRRARTAVYGSSESRNTLVRFFSREYWVMVAARPVALLIAGLLFLLPAALAGAWAADDPAAASGLLPAEFQSVKEDRPDSPDLGLGVEEQTSLSTVIFINNIQVALLAFAAGMVLAIGAAAVLVYNGTILGAVAGIAASAGDGRLVYELVVAHGVLELSCIVVAGAAGMRLGWAMVEPGSRSRGRALVEEGRSAVMIVLGTTPWLVLAGLVEGFITPSGLGVVTVTVVGFGLGAVYWGLVLWRGAAYNRALAFARR